VSSSTDARRLAFVTGGAAGLPRGVVEMLAPLYRVAFTYRAGGTPPEETLNRVRAHDAGVLAVPADGTTAGSLAAAVERVVSERGPIDVAVHGIGPIVVRPFARSTAADYRLMIDGNLGSAVELAAAVLPSMRARHFGRLIFFGMNGSHVTLPARGMSLYGAAKAAVVQFARTLALEEGRFGITANAVEPGDIRDKVAGRAAASTQAANNPTGHAGSWEDIAYAVKFLASDEAAFINGAVIGVNGGLVEPYEAQGGGAGS
jgi:NAD(P)-dependent dehydrogenase (short-subunit alcohol dehydrogenase family)